MGGYEVRLLEPWAGMPAGSEGTLIGWYAQAERMALVRFWDGGPLQVPDRLVERIEGDADEPISRGAPDD